MKNVLQLHETDLATKVLLIAAHSMSYLWLDLSAMIYTFVLNMNVIVPKTRANSSDEFSFGIGYSASVRQPSVDTNGNWRIRQKWVVLL